MTAFVHQEIAQDRQAEIARSQREAARQFHFELQRRMDMYAGANRALAAFFAASEAVTAEEFENYVGASQFLSRRDSVRVVGFLPRVRLTEVPQFERQAREMYPDFSLRGVAADAEFAFPLLFVKMQGNASASAVRGLDFSTIPERYDAMLRALERDGPAATRVHPSLEDSGIPVVQIFTPIRTNASGVARRGPKLAQAGGFGFSGVRVRDLFINLERGEVAAQFDLEVYDGEPAAANTVFDLDRVRRTVNGAEAPAYTAELQLADRTWGAYFYPVPKAWRTEVIDLTVLAIGGLLSLIAAYLATIVHARMARRRASGELMDRFNAFFANHPFAVYSLDPQWRIVHANQKIAQELGVPQAELIGRSAGDFVAKENRAMAEGRFKEALAGEAVAYTNVIVDKAGRRSDVSVVLIPMGKRGKPTHVLGFAENITERKRAEAELYESRQMLRLILDSVPQRIFWRDLDGVYQGANRVLLADAGLTGIDQLVGKTDEDMPWCSMAAAYRAEDQEIIRSGQPLRKAEHKFVAPDGSEIWMEVIKLPLLDGAGKPVGILGVAEDVTERKAVERELFHRANFDSLTSLPNRSCFRMQLEQAVKRAARREQPLALMYFDIDHFKSINDTHGHNVGDEVIRIFAQRVRSAVRTEDVVARLGGDEFVLIVEGQADPNAIDILACKLVQAVTAPFEVSGIALTMSTSIGIAFYKPGMTPDQLIKAADDAMYEAKRSGRNCFRRID